MRSPQRHRAQHLGRRTYQSPVSPSNVVVAGRVASETRTWPIERTWNSSERRQWPQIRGRRRDSRRTKRNRHALYSRGAARPNIARGRLNKVNQSRDSGRVAASLGTMSVTRLSPSPGTHDQRSRCSAVERHHWRQTPSACPVSVGDTAAMMKITRMAYLKCRARSAR